MPVAGLVLPAVSAFDPPAAGEGSIDPMGLAAISDRLADLLVPGLRARMSRVRFVTAISVGALACEPLADEPSADGISTSAICFEWLLVEGMVRRLAPQGFPSAVPGSQKARSVIGRGQRLAAPTYLKGPAVFGFNGVYKPFALDSGIVDANLQPAVRCAELARSWEHDQGFDGFTDEIPGSDGGNLRSQIRDEVLASLRAGRCTTNPGGWLFGRLANALRPDEPGSRERAVLRALVIDDSHETRAELARLLQDLDSALTEAQMLDSVRPRCSPNLGQIVDAVTAYERFAALVDAAFRTLCSISHSLGSQPLTPQHAKDHDLIVRCSHELPDRYRKAADAIAAVTADLALEQRLGEFAIRRTPIELVQLALAHHEQVQASKPPNGKRSWFEPVRDGWVVRSAYGSAEQPELGPRFVHPVRVAPLHLFMEETAP